MLSKVSVLGKAVRKKSEKHRARTPERFSRDVFFDFFWDASRETLTLETTFGQQPSEIMSKVSDLHEAVRRKSKKHHARAPSRAKSDDLLSKNNDFGTLPRIPSDPVRSRGNGGIYCGSDPPTSRAGGQDDGSYANSLNRATPFGKIGGWILYR